MSRAIAAPPAPSPDTQRWPIADVLTRLADAADHLLHDHDCDRDGHEMALDAIKAAREHVARLTAPPAASEEEDEEALRQAIPDSGLVLPSSRIFFSVGWRAHRAYVARKRGGR